MQKRGYFFTLDAFIAVIILVVGVILVLSMQNSEPYQTQSLYISQDLLSSLSSTDVTEINQPYINNLRANGTITNFENSILDQAAEFYSANKKESAAEFLKSAISSSVAEQYGFRVLINNELIYNNSDIDPETKVLTSSKTIVFGIANGSKMWGPYIVELTTWQR